MKKKITLALIAIVAVCAMSLKTFASDKGVAGYTGSYLEGDCTQCHGGTANTGPGSITINPTPAFADGGYVPGTKYTIKVTVTNTGMVDFGFDLEALLSGDTTNAGTLAIITDSTNDQIKANAIISGLTDVTHTQTGYSGNGTKSWYFYWTAPTTGTGIVTFFEAGVANTTTVGAGGNVYTDSLVVPQTTMGINELNSSAFNLSVFPNPLTENMNVKFSLKETSSVTMEIFDVNGNKVSDLISENEMNGDVNKTFNVSTLAKGIYFVRLNINGESTIQKIVVE
jgi:hypothetical protein